MRLCFHLLVLLVVFSIPSHAQISLDLSGPNGGALRVGPSAEECTPDIEGGVRYNPTDRVVPGATLNGLVAHWKLDETGGTTVVDSTGTANGTLTNMNPASDWIAGRIGNALDFDGSNDYVALGTSSELQPASLTVSAWIRRQGTWGAWNTMLFNTKGNGAWNDNGWYLEIKSDPWGLNLVVDGGNIGNMASPSGDFPINEWVHVAATFDTSTNEIKMYWDGEEQAVTIIGSPTSITPSSAQKYIGRNTGGSSIHTATIDDIRIYNRALDTNEVLNLHNCALENLCDDQTFPKAIEYCDGDEWRTWGMRP